MMHAREQGDGDKRWYCPERDICYAFPRTLRKALEAFNGFEGNDKLSLAELGQACKVLGQIVQGCRVGGVTPDDVVEKLQSVPQPALDLIGSSFMYTFFAELVVWCSEVRPKDPQDVPIDTADLEKILEKFASSSRATRGNDDEEVIS